MRLKPIALSLMLLPASVYAVPSLTGQSGLMNMPDARVEQDGNFGLGYSYDSPYSTLWLNLTALPALQVNARFVGVRGTSGFDGKYSSSYGSYKDKVIDVKLRLLDEQAFLPEVAVGRTDIFGTELFRGDYVVASKQIGSLDTSLGYGSGRIDGVFGGVRWLLPGMPGWALLAEYDANNYQHDFRASSTYAGKRKNGPVVGVSYRWGWLGAELVRSKTHSSISTFVSIPFNDKEFVPKFQEPAAYSSIRNRPTAEQWHADSSHKKELLAALHAQDYKAVGIAYKNGEFNLSFTNTRISNIGRSVARALKTAMYFAPVETRVIKLHVASQDIPLAEYEFFNVPVVADYLNGKASREQLRDVTLVSYAKPGDVVDEFDVLSSELNQDIQMNLVSNEDGQSIQLKGQDKTLNTIRVVPKAAFYFNDPSGALRYELNAYGSMQWHPSAGNYVDGALTYKLFENVSKVDNPSNSELPHVRSDIAEYKKGNRFRLNRAAYTYIFQPAERVYSKVSAGVFEDMFSGVAGQLVYFPANSRWIGELSAEAVQQRDYNGWFGRKDYKTVTGLASLHYKLPAGVTATARVGRFLAKDEGVRFEAKRRFKSGIEAGAWYTYTNGNDITSPGTPSSPYHDRGIFLSIPLSTMMTFDSQSVGSFGISPWTRDVGQTVVVPHDLVGKLEEPARQVAIGDGLGDIGDTLDPTAAGELPDPVWWPSASGIRMRLSDTVDTMPELSDAAVASTIGVGAVALAATRDKQMHEQLAKRSGSKVIKAWDKAGRWAPLMAVGAAGAGMVFGEDPILVNTSIISLQSAGLAAGLSVAAKKLVDRARPEDGGGKTWASASKQSASFPSNHSAVTMAVLTPYAEEYQLPWLYAVGGFANAGRVAGNKHWVSDVVAGSLLGYAVGYQLWKGQRDIMLLPTASVDGKTLALTLHKQY